MMEAKLKKAAAILPLPRSNFDDCIARVPQKTAPVRRFRPVLIALAIVIMLGGCSVAVTEARKVQGMRPVLSSRVWWDAESRAEKNGLTLPETFGDYTFRSMNVMVIVPRYMHVLEAMFYPGYRSVDVVYACDGDDYALSVSFGDIEDDYWRTFFGYESDGSWNGSEKYEALEPVEYKGFTIHTGVRTEGDFQSWTATWVDAERGVCVDVTAFDDRNPLPLAMEIIDSSNS